MENQYNPISSHVKEANTHKHVAIVPSLVVWLVPPYVMKTLTLGFILVLQWIGHNTFQSKDIVLKGLGNIIPWVLRARV